MHKIYQVNIGGYDVARSNRVKTAEYHLVTSVPSSSGNAFIDSRTAKFNPPFPLEKGAIVLYIDGAFQITQEGVEEWMTEQLGDNDIVFNASFNVNDCYEEGDRVLARGIGNPKIIRHQLDDYRSEGVEGNNNHAFGGIFIFRDSKKVRRFLQEWQQEFTRYPSRDQIALHKLRQHTKLKQGWINPYTIVKMVNNHDYPFYFTYHRYHKPTPRPKINFITGWDSYRNIGDSLNRQIERMDEDEWICVMDGDITFLTSYWGKQMEDAILRYPDTAIFSCYTNRIGLEHQLLDGFSQDMDIRNHRDIAMKQSELYWDECKRVDTHVAGLLQLFPKWYWDIAKYQRKLWDSTKREGKGSLFDWEFCNEAISMHLPIRLLKGIYVFHCYRLDAEEGKEKTQIDHLV